MSGPSAFAAVAEGYDFRRTTEGEYVVVLPKDANGPRVAYSLDSYDAVYEWMPLLAEREANFYGRAQVVVDLATAYARSATQFSPRTFVATRLHQYDGDDGRPRVSIDLGDPWVGLTVQVGPSGWFVHDPRVEGGPFPASPVWHRGPRFGVLPVPGRPEGVAPGEAKAWFREALALEDRDWRLTWLWMMGVYFPRWTQQGLMFVAPTKMGKSLRSAWLLRFVSPADPDLGGIGGDFPTTERAWGSLMQESPVLAFDDVESISAGQHQALKQVITGARFSTQKLYSTRGLVETTGKRPLLITASGTPAGFRDDLRNRVAVVSPVRPPYGRDLSAEFERRAPAIFADLLDDLSLALRGLPEALDDMDDLLARGEAVRPRELRALARSLDRGCRVEPGSGFEAAMLSERADSLAEAAEEDRFARVVVEFVRRRPEGGELSNDALLAELRDVAMELYSLEPADLERAQWFPSDTGRMGSWLGRKSDSLAAVDVVFHRTAPGGRYRGRRWDPLPGGSPAPVHPVVPAPSLDVNLPDGPAPRLGDPGAA